MTVTIEITHKTRSVLIDVSKLEGTHKKGLKNALHEIGNDVTKETKRLIKVGPKTGRIYNYKGRKHQASAPGEAPANRSGRLMKSTKFRVRNWQEMTVGQDAEYAGYLQRGVKRRMAPRPSIEKAVHNKAQDTVNAILDSVRREIT